MNILIFIVFNDYKTGEIIADKSRTNCVLTKHGVLMPEEIKSSIASKDCLSLSKTGSGKQIQVIKKDDRLDPNRYNVEFINTKIVYDQKSYYTAVRLWCIGKELLFPVVRSRLIEEGPSVHDSNTYINIDFLTYLQESLIIPNIEKFEKIAEEIEKVFGLGFYVYDLVIDTKTKEIFVCEVGYKFQDYVCQKRFRKIIKHLPFYQALEKSRFLNLMQKAFISEYSRALALKKSVDV